MRHPSPGNAVCGERTPAAKEMSVSHGVGLSPQAFGAIRSEDVIWSAFPAFPPSVRLAILVGDITKAGPYVIRVKAPAGATLMPHKHQEDRIYTVVSGIFYIGRGETFDPEALEAYAPGSVIVLPRDTPHFHWAKSGEYISQVSGTGPLGLEYIHRTDDPRE